MVKLLPETLPPGFTRNKDGEAWNPVTGEVLGPDGKLLRKGVLHG